MNDTRTVAERKAAARRDSDAQYVEARIASLTTQGAINGLRGEASVIRVAVTQALNKRPPNDEASSKAISYDWIDRQLARARAFDEEADRLIAERPSGAAGLSS